MCDVTHILGEIEAGDPLAADKLMTLIYDELRKLAAEKMAQENPGQTLQATALVHEAYIRLVNVDQPQHWDSRGHFFAAAAEAMRRILIDRARDKKRLKRDGCRRRVNLDEIEVAMDTPEDELLALNDALNDFCSKYPDCGKLVKLRFFAGLPLGDAALLTGMPKRTADRNWAFARAWLHRKLQHDDLPAAPE
ncbi:MAG: sigma-70 family RNA polymerase sigma factor [Pirellulaceae bacterium]